MAESCKLKIGRPKIFSSPQELWNKACLFFSYCQDNPIPKLVSRRGKLFTIYKIREMPFKDLYAWLGVYDLRYYKKQQGFSAVVSRIQNVVYEYNFIYAAAGMLRGRSVGHVVRKSRKSRELDAAIYHTFKTTIKKEHPFEKKLLTRKKPALYRLKK